MKWAKQVPVSYVHVGRISIISSPPFSRFAFFSFLPFFFVFIQYPVSFALPLSRAVCMVIGVRRRRLGLARVKLTTFYGIVLFFTWCTGPVSYFVPIDSIGLNNKDRVDGSGRVRLQSGLCSDLYRVLKSKTWGFRLFWLHELPHSIDTPGLSP